MRIIFNGRMIDDSAKAAEDKLPPRLRWVDIGILAGLKPAQAGGRRAEITNTMTVNVQRVDDEKPVPFKHGYSLILEDDMKITASR